MIIPARAISNSAPPLPPTEALDLPSASVNAQVPLPTGFQCSAGLAANRSRQCCACPARVVAVCCAPWCKMSSVRENNVGFAMKSIEAEEKPFCCLLWDGVLNTAATFPAPAGRASKHGQHESTGRSRRVDRLPAQPERQSAGRGSVPPLRPVHTQ